MINTSGTRLALRDVRGLLSDLLAKLDSDPGK
jgi:hypothetical protein